MSEADANAILNRLGFDARAEFDPDLKRLTVHPGPRLTHDQLRVIGREIPGAWAAVEFGSPLYWTLPHLWSNEEPFH